MTRTEQVEIERKYDVADGVRMPSLDGVGAVATARTNERVQLRAVYVDTAEHLLLAHRVTLRRRTGGHDEGWHLKLPGDLGRREIHMPLGADPDEPLPTELRNLVEVVLRGRPVHPVLVLDTLRTTTDLLDAAGVPLAEVADDVVTASNPDTGTMRTWREWEVELVGEQSRKAGESLQDAVGDALESAGAELSASKSKLARGLGDTLPGGAVDAPTPVELPKKSAARFVVSSLRPVVAELHRLDGGVRDGDPAAVSEYRSIVRRLRSILVVFNRVLDDDIEKTLKHELKQLSRVTGVVTALARSQARLPRSTDLVPVGFVSAQATGRIEARLREEAADAARDLRRALDDPRYFSMLDAFDVALTDLPSGSDASMAVRDFEEVRILGEQQRVRKLARRAIRHRDDMDALDEARKAARRLHHADEAVTGVEGGKASASRRTVRAQKAGGALSQARAAVELYLEGAEAARRATEDTFPYGALATAESLVAVDEASRLRRALAKL